MNPDSNDRRDALPTDKPAKAPGKTPNTDMQADDAGTADSGAEEDFVSGAEQARGDRNQSKQ